ncbi:heat shock 70kDa protein 8 [Trichonephila clavipes]|nr:heat shock 70kDa protein 8 [Trichonephila clavipes]
MGRLGYRSAAQIYEVSGVTENIWAPLQSQVFRTQAGSYKELWFQQDGATCHTARATIDLLKDTFGDRLISRFGPVNWPPRSCDLTPLDYFLWGYVKSLVYADKPQTLDHLEDNIRRVIADIRSQMLEKVIENWTSRLDYIRASRGSHTPEIIFKM